MQQKTHLSIALLVTASAAVASIALPGANRPEPVNPLTSEGCRDLPLRPVDHACPSGDCGSNDAFINNFPIDGLHPGGCWNQDRMRLVPGSLTGGRGKCPDRPMTLDVDAGGVFVGKTADTDTPACQGSDLVGATFTVERQIHGRTKAAKILIAESGNTAGRTRSFPSYKLTLVDDSSRSLCVTANSDLWMARWAKGDLPSRPSAFAPGITTDEGSVFKSESAAFGTQAILITGQVFLHNADLAGEGKHWFNIACTGGALAKLKLLDLDESEPTVARRQGALRMVTARYCRKGDSYTTQGPALAFGRPGIADGSTAPVEAEWDEQGATCISHSRMWRMNASIPPPALPAGCRKKSSPICDEARFVDQVRIMCGIPGCDEPSRRPGFWTTHVVDHVPHTL